MQDQQTRLAGLHARLGLKRLSRTWAKAEIFLGLTATGAGLLLGDWAIAQREINAGLVLVSLALFVLGGYLALAGHRSHLYQSSNELTAYLVEEMHRANQRDMEG
jgi:hypothetical protein